MPGPDKLLPPDPKRGSGTELGLSIQGPNEKAVRKGGFFVGETNSSNAVIDV